MVVQNGGYALMPQILLNDPIINVDDPPFAMIPGQLSKSNGPVDGFFYDERHAEIVDIHDLRPEAKLPSDAGGSHKIDYMYEKAEFGYKYWAVEAEHRLDMNPLIAGILNMHVVDDSGTFKRHMTEMLVLRGGTGRLLIMSPPISQPRTYYI
jgi:hypothetical protein